VSLRYSTPWGPWVVFGVLALELLAASERLAGQSVPRTPNGRPDLQGTWLNNTATPLERPKAFGDRAFFTPEEAREYERHYLVDTLAHPVDRYKSIEHDAAAGDIDTYESGRVLPDLRNSLIIDPAEGRVPALTAEGRQRLALRMQHLNEHYADNPEDLLNGERCLSVGNTAVPPLLPLFYNNSVQIVQTPDYVTIVSEMIHDARVISLTRRSHLPPNIRQWKGDSIGHWEGDTLVIDTTNFTDKTPFRGSGPALHLVERWSRNAMDSLTYQFVMDDPESFVRPWTAESVMVKTDSPVFEYACHEANYSIVNQLRGARFEEKVPKD
jgi:hypothetical protein